MTSGQFSSSIAVSKKVVENLKQMKATIVFLALGVAVKPLKLFPGVAILAMALAGSAQAQIRAIGRPFKSTSASVSYRFNVFNPDMGGAGFTTNDATISDDVRVWILSVVTNRGSGSSALQGANGFNALASEVVDAADTYRHTSSASVAWSGRFSNDAQVALPLDFTFRITPGRIQLTDGTSEGMDANPLLGTQSGTIRFNLMTRRSDPTNHATEKWTWIETFGGGRNGQTNTSGGIDPQGLGYPLSSVETNGSRITKFLERFEGRLNCGSLEPFETIVIDYSIQIEGFCDGTSITGPTGALVEIGDPFEIESGELGGIGSSFMLMSGNTVVFPVPLSLFIRPTNNLVELSWPSVASGAVLESNAKLVDTNWNIVASPTSTNGPKISALVGKEDPQRFFRLRQ